MIGLALIAQVTATTMAPMPSSDTPYGRVELTHDAGPELRPTTGLRLLNDRLDARISVGLFRERRPKGELTADVWRSSFGITQAFALTKWPYRGSGTASEFGLRQLGSLPATRGVSWVYLAEHLGTYGSRAGQADVENLSGAPAAAYGLVDADADGTAEVSNFDRKPAFRGRYRTGLAWIPRPAFAAEATVGLLPQHDPKYELRANGTIYGSYQTRTFPEARVEALYRLDERTLLRNELAWRAGPRRWQNILSLDYAVF